MCLFFYCFIFFLCVASSLIKTLIVFTVDYYALTNFRCYYCSVLLPNNVVKFVWRLFQLWTAGTVNQLDNGLGPILPCNLGLKDPYRFDLFKVFWWSVYTLKTISFVLDRLTDINMESKRLRPVQVKVSCPICGKSFSRSDNMKRHRQTHKHPIIPDKQWKTHDTRYLLFAV